MIDPHLQDDATLDDPVARSAYVRRFEAELSGFSPVRGDEREFIDTLVRARVILLGEYHPLPSACRTAVALLEAFQSAGRRCRLGLEMVHARDQRALDAFLAGRIGERELQRRLRYAEEWGYPWNGPRDVLRAARRTGVPVHGLDIPPRGGVADLARRDAVAAERIARLVETTDPEERLIVVFGEAHLAAAHLPRAIAAALRRVATVRVFHDVPYAMPRDAAGAANQHVFRADARTFVRQLAGPAARAAALQRTYAAWARSGTGADGGALDAVSLVHGVIDAQARALAVDPRRFPIGAARWLADAFPEVLDAADPRDRRWLARWISSQAARTAWAAAERDGATYVAASNQLLVAGLSLRSIARESARFLLAALSGDPQRGAVEDAPAHALLLTLAARIDPVALEDVPQTAGRARQMALRLVREWRRGRINGAALRRLATARRAPTRGAVERLVQRSADGRNDRGPRPRRKRTGT